MKEGQGDRVLEKVMKRYTALSGKIAKQSKGIKPFQSQIISPDEQLYHINNLTLSELDTLYEEFGDDGLNFLQARRGDILRRKR